MTKAGRAEATIVARVNGVQRRPVRDGLAARADDGQSAVDAFFAEGFDVDPESPGRRGKPFNASHDTNVWSRGDDNPAASCP